jgi:hypothetical protein
MSDLDSYIMIGIGGFFLLLSLLAFLFAGSEQRGINNALSHRTDLREFGAGGPLRMGPEAIRIGGRLLFTVGLVVLIVGAIFLLID